MTRHLFRLKAALAALLLVWVGAVVVGADRGHEPTVTSPTTAACRGLGCLAGVTTTVSEPAAAPVPETVEPVPEPAEPTPAESPAGPTTTEYVPLNSVANPGPIGAYDDGRWSRTRACIRAHESDTSGGYVAENLYSGASGAYQYLDSTWANYGGYERAKYAPPAVQDQRAIEDLDRRAAGGYDPWYGSGC